MVFMLSSLYFGILNVVSLAQMTQMMITLQCQSQADDWNLLLNVKPSKETRHHREAIKTVFGLDGNQTFDVRI